MVYKNSYNCYILIKLLSSLVSIKSNLQDHRICILKDEDRISPNTYRGICQQKEPHLLLDVRPAIEFEICHLNESVNIPFDELHKPNSLEKLKSGIVENNPDFSGLLTLDNYIYLNALLLR